MSNARVELIAVKKRAIQSFTLPEIPRMPAWVVRQFKLEEWEGEMEKWRRDAQEGIRDALKSIQSE